MNRASRRTMAYGIAIFILMPLVIGVFMYTRMLTALHDYMEDQVSTQTELLSKAASWRLHDSLAEVERVARYLRNGLVPEEEMGGVAVRLLTDTDVQTVGILRLDGTTVSGPAPRPEERPAIQSAFRGRSSVRYSKGEGLLFVSPIYNGENIKYALYTFVAEEALFLNFGERWFDGRGRLLLADSAQWSFVPLPGTTRQEADTFFSDAAAQTALERLIERMNRTAASTVRFRSGGETVFVTIAATEEPNLYLLGIVPHDAIAGPLNSLSGVVLAVFGLLLALLVIGVVRIVNIDAKARQSDELRAAKEEAELASESKGRFLASMSHELRTPINTIMGMNEMILRETGEKLTRERAMDVKSAAQILLGLINDVLDYSKIESGMLTILPVEYDLPGLIRDLALLSDNRARSKSLFFELDIQESLPMRLYGDDLRIQQVLTNLLTNAVKYTNEGSVTLRISAGKPEGDQLLLRCEVIDTGIGITPENIDRLKNYKPFTRVDEQRNRNVEGSGLGLPIIINLLRLMGSELQVESVYGEGSRFYFELPQKIVNPEPIGEINARLEQQTAAYEYRAALVAPKAKVLVVDDNALNRKIFCNLLHQTRVQITTAPGGFKCLELVQQEHFDIIFMDHLMPDMDGLETLRQMQLLENNLCRYTPVVALTANAFSGAREMFLAVGFDAYLSKPIVPEKLEAMLWDMLPQEYLEEAPPEPAGPEPEETALPELEGVDWGFALLHLQDRRLAVDTLRNFAGGLEEERSAVAALARETENEEGLSLFRTRVHALKSMAATVGVLTVSELARLLERAARGGDRERIAALTPVLLEELALAKERLTPLLPPEPKRRELTELSQLTDLLELLQSTLDELNIDAADALTAQLASFAREEPLQTRFSELFTAVSLLDFDRAAGLTEALLTELKNQGNDG